MYFSLLSSLLAASVTINARAAQPACRPFRVHMQASLPASSPHANDLAKCVAHFTSLDQNANGIRDWATVEGTSGEVLYPADPDIDGDGIGNVVDRDPLVADVGSPSARRTLPSHLQMDGERGRIQAEIYEKVGVIAIDHTDKHSLAVLEAFRDVAVRALSPGFEKKAPSLKYLYAFKGHDSRSDIAAYHREMKALSIGGEASWGKSSPSSEERIRIMAALAHETGHAFLFDRMTPAELAATGSRFGNWANVISKAKMSDRFHDPSLMKKTHPLRKVAGLFKGNETEAQVFMNRGLWSDSNIVSRYSTTNVHEWFADAFAADIMNRLGERGLIPSTDGNWKKSLTLVPRRGEWWANYNNVSPSFRLWLKSKLDSSTRASVVEPAAR